MSIRNAGKTIKEARLKASMTQEQLSEGICTVLSLSRIENGSSGVSPITFQALMNRAEAPCELYPIFSNRTDFDCFYALQRARYFLNSWQLQECYDELASIESKGFADNKLYYQEWLYIYGCLLIRSGCEDHRNILTLFLEAIHTTRPDIDFTDFIHLFLSTAEIELLIAIAQEFLYINNPDTCNIICSQIASYLSSAELDYLKKDFLESENAISYSKYLLYIKDYKKALSTADKYRHKMVQDSEEAYLLELTFLTALGYYYTDEKDTAYTYFKNTFYSAHAIGSYYATICSEYAIKLNLFELDDYLSQINNIPQIIFPFPKGIDTANLTDGTYDFFSPDVLTIGRLIHDLRKEQGISQTILCQGLCSKSKLSKIENNFLQPDIFLAEALLQRLGISERVLTFWGNKRESEIFQLHYKLMHSRLLSKEQKIDYMNKFQSLINEKTPNLLQSYVIDKCSLLDSPTDVVNELQNGLTYTLPHFDIRLIHNYCLTWSELSLLNNLAYSYRSSDTEKCDLYFSKLFDYLYIHSLDILLAKNVFTLTYYMYSHSLYVQDRYLEVTRLLNDDSLKILKGNLATFSFFLFYHCQSLAECKQSTSAKKYALYACSIQELFELKSNSDALKKYLHDDFGMCII